MAKWGRRNAQTGWEARELQIKTKIQSADQPDGTDLETGDVRCCLKWDIDLSDTLRDQYAFYRLSLRTIDHLYSDF